MDLIDISRPLSPATAVWPGDQPVEWDWTARMEDGDSVNLGALTLSTHTGTHADAPLHVREGGGSTTGFDLSVFVGTAEVVEVEEEIIRPHHIEDLESSRVLFKTPSSDLPADEWPETITSLHPDTVTLLSEYGVVLMGTDAPSVDPLDSSELLAHHALIDAGIVNIEGLNLSQVRPGQYRLIALPMKVQEADAAPLRAVLAPDVSSTP